MKNKKLLFVPIVILIVLIILVTSFRNFISFYNELISLLLTGLGLIGLFWYVEETHRQSEAQLRPYLRLQWYNPEPGKDDKNGIIQLVNIGKGPATNIKFDKLIFKKDLIELEMKNIPAMSAGGHTTIGKKQIELIKWPVEEIKDQETRSSIRKFLEKEEHGKYEIIVTYKDLEKKQHRVKFIKDDSYNDGFGIIKQS